jgi:hypothetical protein
MFPVVQPGRRMHPHAAIAINKRRPAATLILGALSIRGETGYSLVYDLPPIHWLRMSSSNAQTFGFGDGLFFHIIANSQNPTLHAPKRI